MGADVFWNFVLTPPVAATRYVKAIEIRPGNARAVHHANLLIDRERSARRLEEQSRAKDSPAWIWSSEATPSIPTATSFSGSRAASPRVEPDGMAWRLDPGNDLVLNVHLQPSGKPELVQPSDRAVLHRPAADEIPDADSSWRTIGALDIPPGARDFVVSDDFRLPLDVDVLAIYPHAHYLGHVAGRLRDPARRLAPDG